MVHERFDLQMWSSVFPISKLREEGREFVLNRRRDLPGEYADESAVEDHIRLMSPGGNIIVSPEDIAVMEHLREESQDIASPSDTDVPTDIIVWGKGEPANRAATKIGGLPYWPAEEKWPCTEEGKPLPFIAQISFLDSQDIVPRLPGDILLIFGEFESLCNEPERLYLKWVMADETHLVNVTPKIDSETKIAPLYGVIHRTADRPKALRAFAGRYKRGWRLAILEGTKIGGIAAEIQPRMPFRSRFLCALGSVSVGGPGAYPFVNVPEPAGWNYADDLLQIGDMGSLFIWRNWNGRIRATADYY